MMDSFLVPESQETSKESKRTRSVERETKLTKMDLASLEARCHGDIEFIDIFKLKKNWNHVNLPFEGLGKKKLSTCIDNGICSAKDLLQHEGGNTKILP